MNGISVLNESNTVGLEGQLSCATMIAFYSAIATGLFVFVAKLLIPKASKRLIN